MTPEEKAKEIVQQMVDKCGGEDFEQLSRGKNCAVIAVDEILHALEERGFHSIYWQQVKKSIDNL